MPLSPPSVTTAQVPTRSVLSKRTLPVMSLGLKGCEPAPSGTVRSTAFDISSMRMTSPVPWFETQTLPKASTATPLGCVPTVIVAIKLPALSTRYTVALPKLATKID